MRICLETSVVGLLPRPEAFAAIREAGYQYIELNPDVFKAHEALPEEAREVKKLIEDNGLEIASVMPLYPVSQPDEEKRREGVEKWKRAIENVKILGSELATSEMTGDTQRPAESTDAFRRSMDEILPLFEDAGVTLIYECHPGDFIESSNDAVDLLRSVGSPRLRYLYCCPHTFIMGDDAVAMVEYAGDYIAHVHVADTFRPERIIAAQPPKPHLHLIPGLGEVNIPGVFAALKRIGYSGYLSAVPISYQADKNPGEAARRSREYIEDLLEEMGWE